jgi:CHAD domain-containing protein
MEPPQPRPRSSAGEIARAAFAASVERLVQNDAALRVSDEEEAVHQARVAVRRMRSDLRTFESFLGRGWARDLRERMRRLQDGFSQARDADVLLAFLHREIALLPEADRDHAEAALAPFRAARERAYANMHAMLDEPAYAALLRELADPARQPPFEATANAAARDVAADVIGDAWSALRKRVRGRSRPPTDAELHRIRIAAKRVRYAAEAIAPVFGRRAHAVAKHVEAIQTILGDQHDAVVARDALRALATEGEHAFTAGELALLADRAACEGRRAWRAAWRAAKRAHRRFRRAAKQKAS